MAHEFTSDHLHQSLIKPSFPFLDHMFDQNMEFPGITLNSSTTNINNSINSDSNININVMDNPSLLNFQTCLPFSSDNFFANNTNTIIQPDQLINIHSSNLLPQSLQGIVNDSLNNSSCVSHKPLVNNNSSDIQMVGNYEYSNESKKRKALDHFDGSESSSGISSPLVSESGIIIKSKNCSGKGKRVKSNSGKNEEKPKDVVHVRARRGQATDSHSLAERVRRGKINERLKCLQDIVPGCYKTMGMAVMLDEIINYVQSLQNQVEFLSMKLTAASTFYDFNSETDAVEKLQRAKVNEAKEMERLIKEGYGGLACFHSTWPL